MNDEEFRDSNTEDVAWLYLKHDQRASCGLRLIADEELHSASDRYCVRRVLESFGLIELATCSEAFKTEVKQTVRDHCRTTLDSPLVSKVLEAFATRHLMPLVREIVQQSKPARSSKQCFDDTEFNQLAALCNDLWYDADVAALLEVLLDPEGGAEEALAVIADPVVFAEMIQVPPDEQIRSHRILHGFRRFVEFSYSYDQLLEHLRERPSLRGMAWRLHADWFVLVDRMARKRVEEYFANVIGKAPNFPIQCDKHSAQVSRRGFTEVFDRLRDSTLFVGN